MENWYVVCVKAQRERAAGATLAQKGFETFVPLRRSKRQWSDRQKLLEVPLFPGYVFCRMEATRRLQVLTTPSVFQVVSDGRGPIPVPEEEVEAVRRVANSPFAYEPCSFLAVGQYGEITEGPLQGLKGIVTKVKNDFRLVLSVALLQRSVAVEVDGRTVRPTGLQQPYVLAS